MYMYIEENRRAFLHFDSFKTFVDVPYSVGMYEIRYCTYKNS